MEESKIKVGVIGAGRVGVEMHLPDMRTNGAEVIALADSIEGRAARYAAMLGVPYAFDDYRDLLALPEIEAVSISTPQFTHAEMAIAALQAGKHVYLEKPPTMNAQEMIQVAAEARRAGKLLMTGSNGIYHNHMQALKRYIDRGDLGEIYMVECLHISRRRLPTGWAREKRFAGGGVGMDSSSHRISQVLYLLNTPKPVSVVARTYAKFAADPSRSSYLHMDNLEGKWSDLVQSDVEDTLVAMIQFDTGCTFMLRDTKAANLPDEQRFNVYGTKAGSSLRPLMIYSEAPDGLLTDTTPLVPEEPKGKHINAFHHFFECIREGKETSSPPETAIVIMRILDAIYESAAKGGALISL